MKPTAGPADPKGLIREAFRIEGITEDQCRSILVDWALSLPEDVKAEDAIGTLLKHHADAPLGHPMRQLLEEGLMTRPERPRRGDRVRRQP